MARYLSRPDIEFDVRQETGCLNIPDIRYQEPDEILIKLSILYVQEVVTIKKKYSNIFTPEN